jgi:uncharacterized membrane protein
MAVAVVLALLYVVVTSLFAVRGHHGLRTQMNDLGNMTQALWGPSHGDWLMTQSNDLDGVLRSRLGVHANLIFWLIAPAYALARDERLLLVLNCCSCAAAGLGVFAFARRRLGDHPVALAPAVSFWCSPLVHDATLFDFHVVTVAAALLVWMIWAFDAGRPRLGWLLLALALLCQENIPLVVACYGLFLWLQGQGGRGRRVLACALLYEAVVLLLVVPLLNHGHTISKLTGPDDRYGWLLRTPGAALVTAVQPERLRVPLYLMASGASVCLRSWRLLLLVAPDLLGAMLSRYPWMSRITGTYYWSFDVAVIAMGCVLAAQRSGRWPLWALATATGIFSLLFSPFPHGAFAGWANHDRDRRDRLLARVVAGVPATASVSAQNNLGAHLAERARITAFPLAYRSADYLVFYLRHVGGPDRGFFVRSDFEVLAGLPAPALLDRVETLMRSPSWALVVQRDGFYLFRRQPAGTPAPTPDWVVFAGDRRLLQAQVDEAKVHRSRWARLAVGRVTWRDLLH